MLCADGLYVSVEYNGCSVLMGCTCQWNTMDALC